MKYLLILHITLIFLPLTLLQGQNNGLTIWAASDGVRVDKLDLNHPFKSGNYSWDGDTVRIFGAQNEIIAFQVIAENGTMPLMINQVELKELVNEENPEHVITYVPPDIDPTRYSGRPIQVLM